MDDKERKLLGELAEKAEMVIHLLDENSMSQPQRDLRGKISQAKAYLGQNPTSKRAPFISM